MAKKLKAKHLFELTFVSDAQLSPDGKQVAVVQTTIHTPDNKPDGKDAPPEYRSHIFLYNVAGGDGVQLTHSGEANTQPHFSPDRSQLAFVSKRGVSKQGEGSKPQLYLLPLGGGEARPLTALKAGVGEVAWHPSGGKLAFTSRGDFEDTIAEKGEGRVVDRLFYKGDGVGFRPEEPAQVYLYDLESDSAAKFTKLKGSPGGLVFSPDGDTLYFVAAKDRDAEDAWQRDLWALTVSGDEKPRKLISNLSRVFAASPSPDGTQLALLASTDQENFASPTGLWLAPAAGGEATLLTGDLETVPGIGGDSQYGDLPNHPSWADDSKSVFVNLNQEGRSGIARVALDGRVRTVQKGDRAVTGFHHAAGRFAFTAETPHQPGEVFVRDARGKETRLSAVNERFTESYRLSEVSPVRRAKARSGPKVAYWTLGPHKPRKDRALVLQVHGGPHTNYGYGFYFEFQLLAAQGYTVVYGNPRGSSSYGADFTTTMQGRYGTVDADDVLAIANAARKAHTDSNAPMHLTGGSYGGFMTNWLVTQTDLFRSAVTQRSICNWASFYGTSDIGYQFAAVEVAGNPWDDLDKLWQQSPLKYVANVATPLLIIHSENDHRCPIEQAEQLFVALKRLDKETQLLRFPDEGHELSRSGRPDRRVQRLNAISDWFGAHP
jgi:dipeptidyl aminopeptidase/acylaminoacyl peptidase